MKTPGYALLLALVTSAHAEAQTPSYVVRGRVIDDLTRAPVNLVVVQLVDTAGTRIVSAVTGEDGLFQLSAPRSDGYRGLRAELLGYFPREIKLSRSDVTDQFVEILMSPRPMVLDSMLVRARPTRPLRTTEQLLHGRLIDDQSRTPIAGGTIELLRADGRRLVSVTTDASGLFRLVTPLPGNYRIRATAMGYRTADSPVLRTMLGDTIRFNFNLRADAVLLSPIIVTASSRDWLDRSDQSDRVELYRRMDKYRGFAQYLTRDSIAAYAALGVDTRDVMIHVFNAGLDALRAGRSPHGCAGSMTYLDGGPFSGNPADLFGLHQLEAIEYYRAPVIPPELTMGTASSGLGGHGPCQVTVFWTRR